MNASKLIAGVLSCLLLCAITLAKVPAYAAQAYSSVPGLIHYQGRLVTADGVNVDGGVAVQVFIYDSPTLGASWDPNDAHVLYAEDQGNANVTRGTLRFTIGEGAPLGPFMGAPLPLEELALAGDLYVGLYVNGELIEPRQRIGMRNAAIRAQYARTADNVAGDFGFNQSNLPAGFSANKVTTDTISSARINNVPSGNLSGAVSSSRLPNNIPLSKISGGTLSTAVVPSLSADLLTSGSGPFPIGQIPADVLRVGNIGFDMDTLNHGGSIPAPSGFNLGQCAWTVAYHNTDGTFGINDGIDDFRIFPGDAGNPTVTCQLVKGSTVVNCQVDYVIICKK